MPINKDKMKAMKKTYGDKKGEDVYYATENKQKHEAKKSTPKKSSYTKEERAKAREKVKNKGVLKHQDIIQKAFKSATHPRGKSK